MALTLVRSNRRISTRVAILLLCAQITLCCVLAIAVALQPPTIEYQYDIGYVSFDRAFGLWAVVLLSLFPITLLVHKVRPIRYIGPVLIMITALQCFGLILGMDSGGNSRNLAIIEGQLGQNWRLRLDRTMLPYYLVLTATFLFWSPLPKIGHFRRFLFETLPARFQLADFFAAFVIVAVICALFRNLWTLS